jgi:membrane-associated phospholipid phosphatase
MRALRIWMLTLALVALAVVLSFYWLDRPLALFVHNWLPQNRRTLIESLTYIPDPLIWIATVTFVGLGLWSLAGRSLSKMQAALMVCGLSFMAAETIKNELKFVFGRTWPETWYQNNPSFIHDGIYGFNWFHGGDAYRSFPSGHMTVVCAVASVLWFYYPRLRAIYVAAALVVFVGLVGANFHFLSDCIAGAFAGASVGLMSIYLLDNFKTPCSGA